MTLQDKKEQAAENKDEKSWNEYDAQFQQIANPDNHNLIDNTINKIIY
jgi:hypothetical protein